MKGRNRHEGTFGDDTGIELESGRGLRYEPDGSGGHCPTDRIPLATARTEAELWNSESRSSVRIAEGQSA